MKIRYKILDNGVEKMLETGRIFQKIEEDVARLKLVQCNKPYPIDGYDTQILL